MPTVEIRMTPVQMASLLDAALRSSTPVTFLTSATTTFTMIGRHADATASTWIACLLAEGEMELLLGLGAAWKRGEDRCPAEAARSAVMGTRHEVGGPG